jgi:tetratricopeptide (TPR) repeat protein
MQAEQQISSGEVRAFTANLATIITLNPDELRLRDLVGRYWLRIDETVRKTEKEALEIIHALEGFETPESVRKNQGRIQKLIAAFHETIEKGVKESSGDASLTVLVQRFERVTAALAKKREEHREEHREVRKEEAADSGEAVFRKGISLLEGGQFDAAAKLFEKLARTQGYQNVAGAYVYLGITSLARTNQSKVNEAKKLRLKGIASFQNALRFDRKVTLPAGYLKFKDIFEEARSSLK